MTCASCSSKPPLCATCRAQRVSWSVGIARDRGVAWAARARRQRPGQVWPAWEASEGIRRRAGELVRDLAIGDLELEVALAQACAEAAAHAYASPPAAPGSVAF